MRCTSPRDVSQPYEGAPLNWSKKKYNASHKVFKLPCGKCAECKLEYARSWAVRCVHEAKMHEENSFLTLTYNEESIKELIDIPHSIETGKEEYKLNYEHVQQFMKRLRKTTSKELGFFATGEYGDRTNRPHWHILIFGWYPTDSRAQYKNHRGDQICTSEQLGRLWPHGNSNVGTVTFESAGYVARYAAKKLGTSQDDQSPYKPISKKSQRNAIGKKFLQRYYEDIFNHGYVVLDNGSRVGIPRYYEKWLKKEHPEYWAKYVAKTKAKIIFDADQKAKDEKHLENYINAVRLYEGKTKLVTTRLQAQKEITENNLKQLNGYRKL